MKNWVIQTEVKKILLRNLPPSYLILIGHPPLIENASLSFTPHLLRPPLTWEPILLIGMKAALFPYLKQFKNDIKNCTTA